MTRSALLESMPGLRHRTPGSREVLIVLGLVLTSAAAVLLWATATHRSEPQLERLSEEQRRALYQRAFADLELCATVGDGLAEHCEHQAELIVRFPECEASCRALAGPWQAQPSR